VFGGEILAALAAGFIGLGAAEHYTHRRRLARIPLRIHVGGTRGKSSVTRLIAAGLREAGIVTAAKTTGTLARMILPDGREAPIYRPAGPNIIEQRRVVAAAAATGCQALVIECMALLPELHWVCEQKLIRATHAVITNARADHLEVMGPDERAVALALAGVIPPRGVVFTAEQRCLDELRAAAADRQARLIEVTPEQIAAVSADELAQFTYAEHAENVAVALAVTGELGVPREVAMAGMKRAAPDVGALSIHTVSFFGRRLHFVNGFAANDPESTERIWRLARERFAQVERTVAVFNLRADRPFRTAQLARDAVFWREADRVALIGGGSYHFARAAAKAGADTARFIFADHPSPEAIFEDIVEACAPGATLIIGMGNIGGAGLPLARFFKNRSTDGG
jgi:poly-gamma-glutamate synthase PgsB/CapB